MKYFKTILFIALSTFLFSGCSNGSSATQTEATPVVSEFFTDVTSVLNQGEDEEPLTITEIEDETSIFDQFL